VLGRVRSAAAHGQSGHGLEVKSLRRPGQRRGLARVDSRAARRQDACGTVALILGFPADLIGAASALPALVHPARSLRRLRSICATTSDISPVIAGR